MSLKNLNLPFSERNIFLGFGLVTILSIAVAILTDSVFPLGIPVLIILVLLLLINYEVLYYILIVSLPFSINKSLAAGLTLDLPTEPIMILLTGSILGSLFTGFKIEKNFLKHPAIILIALMYVWAVTSTFFSADTTKSIKFLLAKIWYLVPFVFFTGILVQKPAIVRKIVWCFLIPLFLLVLLALFKHMLLRFSFDGVQASVEPFFKNHVIYSATVALIVPYLFTLLSVESKKLKVVVVVMLVTILIAIGFSYTRASWLSLPVAGLYYLALRFKITKFAVVLAYAASFAAMGYFLYQNNFMMYAPDYEKTVFNRGDLEKHLEATYKFEDVSGMERVYRWVAAVNMAYDMPLLGSGPNTFYPVYKKYTVSSFKTYVSDNPEKSTTHNYFLLQLAEQGVVGLVLFLIFTAYILTFPQRIYHRARTPELRALTAGAAGCIMVIVFHLLLNELIEVDKIGSFYFISLAILIKLDIWTKKQANADSELI